MSKKFGPVVHIKNIMTTGQEFFGMQYFRGYQRDRDHPFYMLLVGPFLAVKNSIKHNFAIYL